MIDSGLTRNSSGRDVPGADEQATTAHQEAQLFFTLRAALPGSRPGRWSGRRACMFDKSGSEAKMSSRLSDQADELEAELLEGEVPFAVPVGVGDEV